jgi:hypothetical protein
MYAAGDLVNFPLPGSNSQRARIEHWRVAQQQAKTAAASMMGLEQPYEGILFFGLIITVFATNFLDRSRRSSSCSLIVISSSLWLLILLTADALRFSLLTVRVRRQAFLTL